MSNLKLSRPAWVLSSATKLKANSSFKALTLSGRGEGGSEAWMFKLRASNQKPLTL